MPASPSQSPRRKAGPRGAAEQAGEGERFLELYGRYRDVVRQELEAGGLNAVEAERLVGAVFKRLGEAVGAETALDPLTATIRTLAREVSAAPQPFAENRGHWPAGPHRTSGG